MFSLNDWVCSGAAILWVGCGNTSVCHYEAQAIRVARAALLGNTAFCRAVRVSAGAGKRDDSVMEVGNPFNRGGYNSHMVKLWLLSLGS
jgi:hypothetical protein